MDYRRYNRVAWNREVERGNRWTIPVDAATVEAARRGEWSIVLTPTRPVPRSWFPELVGARVLCLASGGGQQAPVLAAAGARVVVLDASTSQLGCDREVAIRDGLPLLAVAGDMAELAMFRDESFDLIVHPVANCFVDDVRPVWREAHRVLRPGGALLSGFANPVAYIFDESLATQGRLEVRHAIPYSDLSSLTPSELQAYLDRSEPLLFGHSLEDQIGGQLEAGFVIEALYEDRDPASAISRYLPTYLATRAVRPQN